MCMIAVDNDAWEQWGIGRGGQAVAVVGMRVPRVDRTHWGVALTLAASSAIRTQHTRPTACNLKVLQHTIIDWHNITVLKTDQQNIYYSVGGTRGGVRDVLTRTATIHNTLRTYGPVLYWYTGGGIHCGLTTHRCKQTTNSLYIVYSQSYI